jgi:hypothetical protein
LLDSSTSQNTNILSAAEFLRSNFKKNADRINRDIGLNNMSNALKYSVKTDPIETNFRFSSERILLKDSSINNLFVRAFNKKKSTTTLNPEIFENNLFKEIDLGAFSNDIISNFTRQQQVYQNLWLNNQLEKALEVGTALPEVKYYRYSDYNTMSRWVKKPNGVSASARIIKLDLNQSPDAFDIRFSSPEVTTHQKITPHSTFLTMKQKRYARKKAILPRTVFFKDEEGKKMKKVKFSGKLALRNNQVIDQVYSDANKQYRFFRKNKKRYENTSILLSKRMLRTRRTLVLPAHVNLTAITNSYDVIHS